MTKDNHHVFHFACPTSTDKHFCYLLRYTVDLNIKLSCILWTLLLAPVSRKLSDENQLPAPFVKNESHDRAKVTPLRLHDNWRRRHKHFTTCMYYYTANTKESSAARVTSVQSSATLTNIQVERTKGWIHFCTRIRWTLLVFTSQSQDTPVSTSQIRKVQRLFSC